MALEPRTPFNEQAALAELERLQQAIQATRRKRQQAMADFQVFLDRSRQPVVAPVPADVPVPVAEPPAAAVAPVGAAELVDPAAAAAPPRRRWLPMAAAIGGLIVAGLAGVSFWPSVQAPTTTTHVVPAESQPAPPAAPVPPPAPPTPAPAVSAGPEAPLRITLTTSRAVWMRVMVDGRRQLEREVPAGERLAFTAERGIVVRAGDAGGVTLTVNDVDRGVLGRNYAIATTVIDVP